MHVSMVEVIYIMCLFFSAVAYHTSRGRPSRNSDVEIDEDPIESISSQHHQSHKQTMRDYDTHHDAASYYHRDVPRRGDREFHDRPQHDHHQQQQHHHLNDHRRDEIWDDRDVDVVPSRVLQRHHSRDSDYTPSPHRNVQRRTPANPL